MALSGALAQILSDRRETYNTKVASVRLRHPGFATDDFDAFVRDTLDPLLGHILAAAPDRGIAFVDAGVDMALALVEHGWTGSRARARVVDRLWREVAPGIAPAIAGDPRGTLGALTNAAIQLAGEPGVNLDLWFGLIAALGTRAGSAAELRALAAIAAWRSGAAHLRNAALKVRIDAALACAAMGAEGCDDWAAMVAQFERNRWWTPDRSARSEGHLVGAFTGFGGVFADPPRLGISGDSIFVASGDRYFLLEADAFGATLVPVSQVEGQEAILATRAPQLEGAAIRAQDRFVVCDWPPEGLVQASIADTIALVSPLSHSVRVFAKALP